MQLSTSPDEMRPSYIAVFSCVTALVGTTLGTLTGGVLLESWEKAGWFAGAFDRYKALINGIRRASPNTWILCLPLTSVTVDYNTADGLSAAKCNEANGWIKTVCEDTGAYYVDAVSAVQDVSGMLLQEYASADGRTLNSTGLNQILQYLRYHAAQ